MRPRFRLAFLALPVALALSPSAHADELFGKRIDDLVRAGKPEYAKLASPLADDAEFLRRIYLDLNGVIPSSEEARAFLKDTDPARRQKLIDRLLESPLFARRMQTVLDVLLMDRRPTKHVKGPEWQEYLRTSIA